MINPVNIIRWHKWLSVLVGLQCLVWAGTGLYFNQMDTQATSGNQYRQPVSHRGNTSTARFIPLSKLPVDEPVLSAELIWVSGTPLYQVKTQQPLHQYTAQQHKLFHAVSGLPWYIQPAQVKHIAVKSYNGPGSASAPALTLPPFEFDGRQQNPLWKVTFNDDVNTEVYLHADTGKVIAHSNDHSRLKHLMLTLHFMDYTNTGGFNHPLIVVFGMATLMLAGSGLMLAYRHRLSASPSAKASVDVTVTYNGLRQTLTLPAKQPLFFALTKHNISVPTECGGGGSCGQCVIQTPTDVPASPIERALLSDAEIASGKRLSCQHMAGEFSDVSVDDGEV